MLQVDTYVNRGHIQLPCILQEPPHQHYRPIITLLDDELLHLVRLVVRRSASLSVVKFGLLLWMLFMACNCLVSVTALETEPQLAVISPEGEPTSGVVYENATQYTDDQADDQDVLPSEVQKAVCTVTAGEVKASAEAVTTKTLKGVCGSAEMNLAFRSLETKLFQEIQEIKILLLQQLTQQNGYNLPNSNNHFKTRKPTFENEIQNESVYTTTTPTTTTTTGKSTFKFQPISAQKLEKSAPKFVHSKLLTPNTLDDLKNIKVPHLKSLPSDERPKLPLREQEVSKFNNTMLTDRDFKVFTYYWKLENFTEHIESGDSKTVESPIFSIKGKPLHIKAFFNHLHRDFLYLQLEYASLKSNNRNNIILDMGGLFKEITNDKVIFKHKISILDQNNQRSKDLVSQEFNNLETGFLIPNSALLASPYIKNNSLLLQIFLYL